MKKIMNWVLAATLVCGTCVFTACSNKDDESGQQEGTGQQEQTVNDRTVFVDHTRAMVKNLAENLNFASWNTANTYNTYFNEYVLNNPEFETSIFSAFMLEVINSIQPVEEGSELANKGFQTCATVDLTNFNYRFTMNDDNTGFDVETNQ